MSSDQFERVQKYLSEHPFNKKDTKKFYEALERIQNIKEEYLKIVFDIIPEPTPRPRMGQYGAFYVKNSKTNNEFVKCMVKEDQDLYHFITTPCKFIVENYFPIPKKMTKVETLLAELKLGEYIALPDWDNLGKTYSDMVQKYIISNDSLITEGISRNFYSLKPRVEITIIYKTEHSLFHNLHLIKHSKSYKIGGNIDENSSKAKEGKV